MEGWRKNKSYKQRMKIRKEENDGGKEGRKDGNGRKHE